MCFGAPQDAACGAWHGTHVEVVCHNLDARSDYEIKHMSHSSCTKMRTCAHAPHISQRGDAKSRQHSVCGTAVLHEGISCCDTLSKTTTRAHLVLLNARARVVVLVKVEASIPTAGHEQVPVLREVPR